MTWRWVRSLVLVEIVVAALAPGVALRAVARRKSLLNAVAAMVLLASGLVALHVPWAAPGFHGQAEWGGGLRLWLRVLAVAVAAWLFLAHLLWRTGWLLGGRGSFRAVAATTGVAFAAGGLLAVLPAADLPLVVVLPVLLWGWWLAAQAVRWGHGLSHTRALAATVLVSAVAWGIYAVALPWRFPDVGVDLLLGMWRLGAPGEHLVVPNLVILGGLAVAGAGLVLAGRLRRWVGVVAGWSVAAGGVAAIGLAAWFIAYLGVFLRSPVCQPQTVSMMADGTLLVQGVGGEARLARDGTVLWRHAGTSDRLLAGPGGSILRLTAADGRVEVVDPDGAAAPRSVEVPMAVPIEAASGLGEIAADGAGRLLVLVGAPMRLYRVEVSGSRAQAEAVSLGEADDGWGGSTPVALSATADGAVLVADRTSDGRFRVRRLATGTHAAIVLFEQEMQDGETWRLAAGLDGAAYLSLTRRTGDRVVEWRVWRIEGGGGVAEWFAKAAGAPGLIATPGASFAVDAAGHLCVADLADFHLVEYGPDGGLRRTIPPSTWYRRAAVWIVRRTRR